MYQIETRQIGSIVAALWLVACLGFLSTQPACTHAPPPCL